MWCFSALIIFSFFYVKAMNKRAANGKFYRVKENYNLRTILECKEDEAVFIIGMHQNGNQDALKCPYCKDKLRKRECFEEDIKKIVTTTMTDFFLENEDNFVLKSEPEEVIEHYTTRIMEDLEEGETVLNIRKKDEIKIYRLVPLKCCHENKFYICQYLLTEEVIKHADFKDRCPICQSVNIDIIKPSAIKNLVPWIKEHTDFVIRCNNCRMISRVVAEWEYSEEKQQKYFVCKRCYQPTNSNKTINNRGKSYFKCDLCEQINYIHDL